MLLAGKIETLSRVQSTQIPRHEQAPRMCRKSLHCGGPKIKNPELHKAIPIPKISWVMLFV